MNQIECQNCTSMFQDLLEGTLEVSREEFLKQHLEGCSACRDLLREFEQITDALRLASSDIPAIVPLPDLSGITETAARQRKARHRQWISVAAVVAVFAGSSLLMDSGLFRPEVAEDTLQSVQESSEADSEGASGYGGGGSVTAPQEEEAVAKGGALEYRDLESIDSLACESSLDPSLERALTDPDFSAEVEKADPGFGYELLECIQEEDGSLTFVLYFYEDDRRLIEYDEGGEGWLSSPNVRSFHWKESAL